MLKQLLNTSVNDIGYLASNRPTPLTLAPGVSQVFFSPVLSPKMEVLVEGGGGLMAAGG